MYIVCYKSKKTSFTLPVLINFKSPPPHCKTSSLMFYLRADNVILTLCSTSHNGNRYFKLSIKASENQSVHTRGSCLSYIGVLCFLVRLLSYIGKLCSYKQVLSV